MPHVCGTCRSGTSGTPGNGRAWCSSCGKYVEVKKCQDTDCSFCNPVPVIQETKPRYKWYCGECKAESRRTWETYGDSYDLSDPLRRAAYEHYHGVHGYGTQSGHRMCGPVDASHFHRDGGLLPQYA